MPTPIVVDLSHHNTIPSSLMPAYQAGIRGVIHKMSEGTSMTDSKVDSRRHLALEAGMLWGLYHFVRPGSMDAQVTYFVGQAEKAKVCDDQTLWVLDHEDARVSVDDAITFLKLLEQATGRVPVIYSGHVLKEQVAGKARPELARYPLWLAQYGTKAVLPNGYTEYWLWQYTEAGHCPGINSPVDLNHYEGTAGELTYDWIGEAPAPEAPSSALEVIVYAPSGVKVTVKRA